MSVSVASRLRGGVVTAGGFTAMVLDVFRTLAKRPFPMAEFLQQTLFIASVSLLPAVMVTVPFVGVVILLINQLLAEIGALDAAGAVAGLAVLRQIGPLAAVLVTASAGRPRSRPIGPPLFRPSRTGWSHLFSSDRRQHRRTSRPRSAAVGRR